MNITIESDSDYHASIQCDGVARHWVELSGCRWELRTGNGFNKPVKTWPNTPKRSKLQDVLPDALAIVLACLPR